MVKTHNVISVIGNHDRDSSLETPVGYNPYAKISCLWTHRQLGLSEQRFLLALPKNLVLNIEDVSFFICHGSPDSLVDEYVFPPPATSEDVLKKYLLKAKTNVVILGHTHIPFVQRFSEGYVINPGSVGQPRSGDPRASYILITVENGKFEFKHCFVEYDIKKVADEIFEVGLPSFLAERLHLGI